MVSPDGLDHTAAIAGGRVTQLLVLDGPHAGHVAELHEDTWSCSCGTEDLASA